MKRLPLLLLFAALWLSACDGCKSKEEKIPETPEARITAIASTLPQNAEAAMFMGDLKGTREALNLVKNKLPDTTVVDGYAKQFQSQFGIDPLDRESWVQAGIAPDSSVMVGAYRSRVLFFTYVENKQQFERILTEKAKNAFQIQAVTKNQSIGGHQMKVLSDDPGLQIAWLYKGKLAMVVLPATSTEGALNDGSASLILAELASVKEEESLAKTTAFKGYHDRFASSHPLSAFVNPSVYADDPEVLKAAEEDPNAKAGIAWAKENLIWAGLGLKASDKAVELDGGLGLKPELAEAAKAAAKAGAKIDWTGFATENVLLGLRVAVDWPKLWQTAQASMPDDQRRAMLRDLKEAGNGINLDIEEDLIKRLTGNVGLFFYGIGSTSGMAGMNPEALIRSAGIMVVIQMESEEAVNNAITKVMSPLAMMATLRSAVVNDEPVEGWRVLEFKTQEIPGRLFINKDKIILASHAFAEKSVIEYGNNQRDEARLKDSSKFDKGKAFGADEPFNGLYLNGTRARNNLGGLLMLFKPAQILNSIEEASLNFGVDDKGGFMKFVVDLEQTAEAAPAADPKEAPKADDTKAPGTP